MKESYTIPAIKGSDIKLRITEQDERKFVEIGEVKVFFNDLWLALFAEANDTQKEQMIPTRTHKVRYLERWVEVKVARDVKRGEKLRFKYRLKIPEDMFVKTNNPTIIASEMNKKQTTRMLDTAKDLI